MVCASGATHKARKYTQIGDFSSLGDGFLADILSTDLGEFFTADIFQTTTDRDQAV